MAERRSGAMHSSDSRRLLLSCSFIGIDVLHGIQ